MNLLRPERLDALAREYALGTLTGGARRRFERELRHHFEAEVAVLAWQQRLATLGAAVTPLEPSPGVWAELERRISPPSARAASPRPTASSASAWAWLRAALSGRSLGGALAGAMLAVVLLREQPAWVGLEPMRESLPASYVGLLHDKAANPSLLASSRRHGRVLNVKMLQPLAVPAGRVAVLWALPKDGGAPFVIGSLPAQGSGQVALTDSAEKIFFSVARLGVSIEAAADAARPSGEFVLTGDCVKLW